MKRKFWRAKSLAQIDVEIISPNGSDIHVSGHPCRDELTDMYKWARPRAAIPVHGEHRHLIGMLRWPRSWA